MRKAIIIACISAFVLTGCSSANSTSSPDNAEIPDYSVETSPTGEQPDAEACALIQEGYQNLQPLLQDKYWLDNDSSARFDAARSDYGTTFQFLDEFAIIATTFDLAAGSSSVSEEDRSKLSNFAQAVRYPSDFNLDTPKASLKLIQIRTDLVDVVGICE